MKLTEDTKIQVYRDGQFLTIGGIWRAEREQILENQENAEKWDKFQNQCLVTVNNDGTYSIKPLINKELEKENKQLKEQIDALKLELYETKEGTSQCQD